MYKVVGDYQLTEKIGKGNFADVYLGTNQKTGIKYAVKVISKETFAEPKLIAGLDAEIKIMKEFTHRNIVQLYKYFSSEKNYYLVVEYCAGGDLNKFIKKNSRLSENTSLNFLAQLAEGLSFLHEKNFIHRDLKPANVLLSENSENAVLKLADFGFARHLSSAMLAQTRCGTPLYMAPEILEARDYDSKADVWSLGCIFYEMLVGTCPFKGTNETDLLFNIRSQSLKLPGSISVSKGSISILAKLLERTASRRASIDQLLLITRKFLADQEAAQAGNPSIQQPTPSSEDEGLTKPSAAELSPSNESAKRAPATAPVSSLTANIRQSQATAALPQNDPKNFMSPGSTREAEAEMAEKMRSSSSSSSRKISGDSPRNSFDRPPSISHSLRAQAPTTPTTYLPADPETPQQGIQPASANYKSRSKSMGEGHFSSPFFPGYIEDNQATPRTLSNAEPSTSFNSRGNDFLARSPMDAFRSPQPPITPASGLGPFFPNYPPPAQTTSPSVTNHTQQGDGFKPAGSVQDEEGFVVVDPNSHSNPNLNQFPPPLPPKTSAGGGSIPQGMSGIGYSISQANQVHGAPFIPSSTPPTNGFLSADPPFRPSSLGKGAAYIWETTRQSFEKTISTSFGASHQHGPVYSTVGAAQVDAFPGSEHELNDSLMVRNLIQRCETYCDTINVITNLADQIVLHEQQKQTLKPNHDSQSSNETQTTKEMADDHANRPPPVESPLSSAAVAQPIPIPVTTTSADSSSGQQRKRTSFASPSAFQPTTDFSAVPLVSSSPSSAPLGGAGVAPSTSGGQSKTLLPPPAFQRETTVDVSVSAKNVNESIDNYLAACSLYFHALTILKNLINSLASYSPAGDLPASAELQYSLAQASSLLSSMKQDLAVMFDQLLTRAENCQKVIDQLVLLSPAASQHHKVMIPKAEILMLQEAFRYENDGSMEELLGNLHRAFNLYTLSKKLVYGVTLTYSEEDVKKVRNQIKSFSDSLDQKLQTVQARMKQVKNVLSGPFPEDVEQSEPFLR